MPLQESVTISAVTADSDFNVKVTLSNCDTTSIGLLAQLHQQPNAPILILPFRKNGTTRFNLEPGHYVFVVAFENADAPAGITLAVETNQNPSSVPQPIPRRTGPTATKRSFATDIFV